MNASVKRLTPAFASVLAITAAIGVILVLLIARAKENQYHDAPEHRLRFVGMTEAQVRSVIGEPDLPRDENFGPNNTFAYSYTWAYYVGAYLTLYFDSDGRVVHEERGSK